MINKVKKNFITMLKNEYEDIIMGIIDTSQKYANEIGKLNFKLKDNMDDESKIRKFVKL